MLKFSRLAYRTVDVAFGIAGVCFVGLVITPAASADAVFRISDGLYVWSGPGGTGMANQLSAGNWVGSGWDSFPGVSPPWNPVVPVNPGTTGIAVTSGSSWSSGVGGSGAVSIAVPQPAAVQVAVPVVAVGATFAPPADAAVPTPPAIAEHARSGAVQGN